MDSPEEEDMHPEEEMRPALGGTQEEPAGCLSAAAMLGEALQEAAATLRAVLRAAAATLEAALRPAARLVERPADCHSPRRTRRSAHWPRRISDNRHCSSRVSLQPRVRVQITG